VDITFLPTNFQPYTSTLTVTSDDPTDPSIAVTLTGTGIHAPTPDIEVTPLSIDFGTVPALSTATKFFEIRNVGDGPLNLTSIRQEGGPFVLGNDPSGFPLAAGMPTIVNVIFAPTVDTGDHGSFFIASDDPDEPEVEVTFLGNGGGGDFEYPVAVIDGPETAAPRDTLVLDGTGSFDPGGDLPLTYAWTLRDVPDGSNATLVNDTSDTAYVATDLAGEYEVALQVTNAIGILSAPAVYRVDAVPTEQLHVELIWSGPSADLDLHLLTSAGQLFVLPWDCTYCNQGPSWGEAGAGDDPTLDLDDVGGYGPENVNIDFPADDEYAVKVHYWDAHDDDSVVATVKIYTNGIEQGTYSKNLSYDQVWDVGQVLWPEGTFRTSDADLYPAPRHGCQ
jgi:hypothetical protein